MSLLCYQALFVMEGKNHQELATLLDDKQEKKKELDLALIAFNKVKPALLCL